MQIEQLVQNMEIVKLDLSLNASQGRLIAKKYEQKVTPIPHSALPPNVSKPLEVIYRAISGEDKFDPDTETFKVIASDGKFKNLFAPQVVCNGDAKTLVIKWGDMTFPVYLVDGALTMANGIFENLKKPKITFVEEEFGGFKKVLLKITVPHGKDLYVTSIPVKLINFKEYEGVVDLLNLAVDQDSFEMIAEKVSDISDVSTGGSVSGHVIKPGHLPLGTYKLTNFYSYESPFGKGFVIQAVSETMKDEEGEELNHFDAIASYKDPVTGEYTKEPVQIMAGEPFAINANNSMKKVFYSGPIINEDKPASLNVTKKFEYNGKPAVKCDLQVSEFIVDENSFQTDW